MEPTKISFYAYSENGEGVTELESALRDLVMNQYKKGVLVTASKLASLIRKADNNPIVNQMIK